MRPTCALVPWLVACAPGGGEISTLPPSESGSLALRSFDPVVGAVVDVPVTLGGRAVLAPLSVRLAGWGRADVSLAPEALDEWWEVRPEGLEHGFTLAPPPGEGPLVFDVAFTGARARLRPEGDGLELTVPGAPALRYDGLVAWDATGRTLPSWMEPTPGGVRLVVDDRGAAGTVVVDPLLSSSSWQARGGQSLAFLGESIDLPDVNGDGYPDLVAGATGYDNPESSEGRAYLYLGSATGFAAAPSWTQESNQASAYFGAEVRSAGDLDRDGYDDVVVSATGWDGTYTSEGKVWMYRGGPAGLGGSSWTMSGGASGGLELGRGLDGAGDVNGDGYDDLIVGAPGRDHPEVDEGTAYVYPGRSTGLSSIAAWTVEPNVAGARFGVSVAGVGDVNADEFDDVLVTASGWTAGETEEGAAFLYLGSINGLSTTAAWSVEADQAFAHLGLVFPAGDVNADGFADVLVTAPEYDGVGADAGIAWLYLGSATGLEPVPAWSAAGVAAYDEFAAAAGPAGDVNGDGYGDVVVGAHRADDGQSSEGGVFLYLGGPDGLSQDPVWTARSNQAFAYLGVSVAGADLDQDGRSDLVVGAEGWASTSFLNSEGAVFTYRSTLTPDLPPVVINEVWRGTTLDAGGDEWIELLVTRDLWGYELERYVVGDAQIGSASKVGRYQLASVSAIASTIPGGTLIVIGGSLPADHALDPGAGDWTLVFPTTDPHLQVISNGGNLDRDDTVWVDADPSTTYVSDEGFAVTWDTTPDVLGRFADVTTATPADPGALVLADALRPWDAAEWSTSATTTRGEPNGGANTTAIELLRSGCGGDEDLDGVCDDVDACLGDDDRLDADADGVPDGCDACAAGDDTADGDADGTADACDTCPATADPTQADADADGAGDACDDPNLALSGTPFAGATVQLVATGALPGETVYFAGAGGPGGAGPCPPQAGGVCLALGPGAVNLGPRVADASGTAAAWVTIPRNLPVGARLTAQVLILRPGGARASLPLPVVVAP